MIEHTIGDLVERCCAAYGDDTALITDERRHSFRDVLSRIRRTGRALRSLGLESGDRVALLMDDRPELLDVYYGAMWAGLTLVPLNSRLGVDDHAYILADSGATALCHDVEHAGRVAKIRDEGVVQHVLCADVDGVVDGGLPLAPLVEAEREAPAGSAATPNSLAGIFYTGGTTGRPKGVMHSHRTFLAAVVSEMLEMGLGERETFAHVAPLTHASGLFVLPTWLRGGTNVVLGGFDPERFLYAIERERITATLMVPTMIYVLLDVPDLRTWDTTSLGTVIYGAAPIGRERLGQALDTFGPVFAQLYGQTEAPNQLTVLSKQAHADAIAQGNTEVLTSCGRPVVMADVRIADDDLRTVPTGEVGEIVARCPHLMLGYWNKPEETESAVRDGWLCTGDLARMDESGLVYIVDRKKDMIVSGGFNVYPKDVERALFEHPSVRDVCVIGVPDEKWGEAVKAVVVANGADAVTEDELIGFAKERAGSVMAPKSVDFVEAIPLTAVGKHDKPALRAAFWKEQERAVH